MVFFNPEQERAHFSPNKRENFSVRSALRVLDAARLCPFWVQDADDQWEKWLYNWDLVGYNEHYYDLGLFQNLGKQQHPMA